MSASPRAGGSRVLVPPAGCESYGTVTVCVDEKSPAEDVPFSAKVAEPAGTPLNWSLQVLLVPALRFLVIESGSLELLGVPARVADVTRTLLMVLDVPLVMVTTAVTTPLRLRLSVTTDTDSADTFTVTDCESEPLASDTVTEKGKEPVEVKDA